MIIIKAHGGEIKVETKEGEERDLRLYCLIINYKRNQNKCSSQNESQKRIEQIAENV
jgi:hypothetical protein